MNSHIQLPANDLQNLVQRYLHRGDPKKAQEFLIDYALSKDDEGAPLNDAQVNSLSELNYFLKELARYQQQLL